MSAPRTKCTSAATPSDNAMGNTRFGANVCIGTSVASAACAVSSKNPNTTRNTLRPRSPFGLRGVGDALGTRAGSQNQHLFQTREVYRRNDSRLLVQTVLPLDHFLDLADQDRGRKALTQA